MQRDVRQLRLAAVTIASALSVAACGSVVLDGSVRCARVWNGDPPADPGGWFEGAIVSARTDRAGDDGCGVVFTSGDRRPWVMFVGVVHDGRVIHWDRVEGMRWGGDSPEGGPTGPNALVLSSGRLVPT